ncbi:MAG: hypothetical protein A2283_12635 [Lentisphaerae bacterium RIFOXYA12_FULL_48_11]|nr:MAG: hypothetical protein A2283_12635 [Lentisphaerae bacterium RIFOXYA12_FULL_48_11]
MKVETISDPRIEFFDSIADKWDTWHDLQDLNGKLVVLLEEFGINKDESILDVGCGTGNLTISLLQKLGPAGRIIAIDISKEMLERARKKVDDNRVTWHLSSADQLSIEDNTMDRVICFSVWPHFQNHEAVARELRRVLRPMGHLHIVHLISRSKVNHIHEEAHPSVHHDHLVSACETAGLLKKNGFSVISMTDDEQRYIITACK